MNALRARLAPVAAWAAIAACSAGCGDTEAKRKPAPSSSVSSNGSPAYQCFDLPGRERRALAAGSGALFYAEFRDVVKTEGALRDDSRRRYDLYRIDADGSNPTKIASDVEPQIEAAPGGRVVFRRVVREGTELDRYRRLFVVDAAGKEIALSDVAPSADDKDHYLDAGVNSFAVDRVNERVFFTARSEGKRLRLFRVPLAGGERAAVGQENLPVVWGVSADGKSVLARGLLGLGTVLVDPASGAVKKTGDDGYGVCLVGETFFFEPRESEEAVPLRAGFLDGRPSVELPWSQRKDILVGADDRRVFVSRESEKREPLDNLLFAGDAKSGELVAHVGIGSVIEAVPFGSQTAVLLQHSTGVSWGESDVCLVSGAGVTLPARSVKKSDLPLHAKVIPLASGDLAGATIHIRTPTYDGAASEAYAMVEFLVDAGGPETPSALQERARALHADVVEATGRPTIGVQILFTQNHKLGEAHFHPGLAGKLLVRGGAEDAPLAVEDPFEVEIDPTQTFQHDTGEHSGSFTLAGKVKNRSSAPLRVKLKTSLRTRHLGEQIHESPTQPETLAPGATGSFSISAGVGERGDVIPLVVLKGGKEIPYLNAYAQRRARGEKD